MKDSAGCSRMKALLSKALLVVLGMGGGLLVGLGGFELWLRHTHEVDLRQTYQRNFGPNAGKQFRPADDLALGWEHIGTSRRDPFGNDNERFPLRKGRGVYRILAIGDSITEQGYYVTDLNMLLNKNAEGKRFEVWNCGVGWKLGSGLHF